MSDQVGKLLFERKIMTSYFVQDLIAIHNAENWLGMDGDSELSMFNKEGNGNGNKKLMLDGTDDIVVAQPKSKFEILTIFHL